MIRVGYHKIHESNMCTGELTDMYARAQGPQAKDEYIHISQITYVHVTTVMYRIAGIYCEKKYL